MSFTAYHNYRDSRIEWLGDLPAHWGVGRFSRVVTIAEGQVDPEIEPYASMPLVAPNHVESRTGRLLMIETAAEQGAESGKYKFNAGDVIYSKIRPSLAKVVMMPCDGLCSADMYPLRGRTGLNQSYLKWVLLSDGFTAWAVMESDRVAMPKINREKLNELKIPSPPLIEQEAIAAFLDRETSKIDLLVEAQRRLIELLKEKRQAVISHAVTKGLDPTASMKDSGVEWLGEVPAHWKVIPLMRLTAPGRDIMYGIVLPGPDVGVGVPIVKGGDVKPHRLQLSLLNWTTPEIEAPFARARLMPGDIVYSIRGSIGDAEPVPEQLLDANITQDVARISPGSEVNPRWLLHVMRSKPIFVQLEQRSLGAAVRGINIFDLKRARVPFPSHQEQNGIAVFLDREVRKFDELQIEAETAIVLLQERRAALVSAAVTGNIDVRGHDCANTEAA